MAEIVQKLRPFQVPTVVVVEGQAGTTFPTASIPLTKVPEAVLAELCNDFRAAVFEKAGKVDPQHAAE